MPTLPYQIEQQNNLAVVDCDVMQLDVTLMQEIVVDMMEHMRHSSIAFFVLDMHKVEFMSSACLGVMVQFLQDLETVRGRVALACCQPNIAFLFKVTRLDSLFRLYDDVETATTEVVRG